jgi:hypothetical protein
MGDCLPSDTGKSKLSGTVPHEHLIALCHPSLIMLTKALEQVSPAGSIFVFLFACAVRMGGGGRILSYFSGIIVDASAMR